MAVESTTLQFGQTWPTLETFRHYAQNHRVIPVVRKVLVDDAAPLGIARRLAQGRPGTFLLESAEPDGRWSRWSFVGVRSSAALVARDGHAQWEGSVPSGLKERGKATELLADALASLTSPVVPGLPPLTGGLVGALGWDVLYDWEPKLRRTAPRELTSPDVSMLLTTELVAVDHQEGAIWLIASAINANNQPSGVDEAYERAIAALDSMLDGLSEPASLNPAIVSGDIGSEPVLRTPQADFESAVVKGKQYISDGDVFQVVLSQRADVECNRDPLDVYRVLRSLNPSPYMYCLQLVDGTPEGFSVVGSSPETLVKVVDGTATTYPIAGSRPRGRDELEDRELATDLLKDPKEVSEHVMLVDLARNDLAKVCEPGTVEVVALEEIKRFSHIMHMSSTVQGRLREGVSALDALRATFPAGTLSGAPKPRAIEVIDELEPARRGIYGGVVGYIDFAGSSDFAIAIRTAVIDHGRASVQAGAGIVADSVPTTEFIETKNKAAAAVTAIRTAASLGTPKG